MLRIMSAHRRWLVVLAAVVLLQLVIGVGIAAAAPSDTAPPGGFFYVVQPGDTLFAIGRRFSVNPFAIARANTLINPNRIFPGQVLFIPRVIVKPPFFKPGFFHVVRPGDTLFGLAFRFGVDPFLLAHINRIPNIHLIRAGQVLFIPN